jgi:hypothetical protein
MPMNIEFCCNHETLMSPDEGAGVGATFVTVDDPESTWACARYGAPLALEL